MIAKQPNEPHVWAAFAHALQHGHGDFQGAIGAYKRVVELDPSSSIAFNNLGYLEANVNHNLVAAEGCYRRSIQLNPGDPNAQVNLGVLLAHERQPPDYSGAEHHFRLALRARPDHLAALVNYGNLLVERPLPEEPAGRPAWPPPEPEDDAVGLAMDWRTGRYEWERMEQRAVEGDSRRTLAYASAKVRPAGRRRR